MLPRSSSEIFKYVVTNDNSEEQMCDFSTKLSLRAKDSKFLQMCIIIVTSTLDYLIYKISICALTRVVCGGNTAATAVPSFITAKHSQRNH